MPGISSFIDQDYSAERSLLLRYHRALEHQFPDLQLSLADLHTTSIREGARIFPLAEYEGVEILACDESSLMATGTYKDLDACLIAAIMQKHPGEAIALSSGGNLGYAMARYARQAGIPVYFFHPKSTLYKMDPANFDWDGVRVITVDLPERQVKALAKRFATAHGIRHVPTLEWRLAASAVRALHITETILEREIDLHWLSQAICAGFGPAGLYQCWSRLAERGLLDPEKIPAFLGVQQAANAPIVKAWQNGAQQLPPGSARTPESGALIEPGLYNTHPSGNYRNMLQLLSQFGGRLLEVDLGEYTRHEARVLRWFRDAGLYFTRDPATGSVIEKAGVLAGVGIVKAIEGGLIRKPGRVLYLLTGGFRKQTQHAPFAPDLVVDNSHDLDEWIPILGSAFGLQGIAA